MDVVGLHPRVHLSDTLTVELGGPRGWAAVVPFVFALAVVIGIGVWSQAWEDVSLGRRGRGRRHSRAGAC